MQGYNVTREQLEMMVFLISVNCKGVVELLLRMQVQVDRWIYFRRFYIKFLYRYCLVGDASARRA